jgi:hypothetical protein
MNVRFDELSVDEFSSYPFYWSIIVEKKIASSVNLRLLVIQEKRREEKNAFLKLTENAQKVFF